MKVMRNILCLVIMLIIGFLFGCSGDVTKSASDNTSTVLGSETSRDGKIKIAKLEGSEILISDENNDNIGDIADQQNPHVIYLPDKNLWFSVYEDWSSLTTGADIKGRFIKSDGTLCGNELTITNVSGNQTVPWATYRDKDLLAFPTGDDTILVVWQDTRANYVYYAPITSFPDPANCSAYSPPASSSGTQIGFNGTERWDVTVTPSTASGTLLIAFGDGTKKDFSATLNAPVVTLSVKIKIDGIEQASDNGAGNIVGIGITGMINYTTGDLALTFATAPASGQRISVDYNYTTYTINSFTVPVNDALLSRKSPKITYDNVRDRFWIVYNESRDKLNRISELCFGFAPTAWVFGDNSFPGYVILRGSDLTELANGIGVAGADIIRNAQVRTNRLISSSHAAFNETYTYEYFTGPNNINTSNDTTSPEDFMVWEGIRQKGVLTCTCEDKNNNDYCDPADIVTSTFATSNYDDGRVHIYGLFDKEIPQTVINSKKVDASSSDTYYPSVAFDPITKRFLTAWEDLRGGSNTKIYGQLVYSGSGLYNQNILISYQDTNGDGAQDANIANSKQTKPFISYDSVNQRYFVIWQDGRNGSVSLENLDIYGQYVDAEGSLRGSNYSISIAQANQYNPTIAYNSQNNQFLAVWKDARNYAATASDIYGQRFSLGQPQLTLLKLDNTPLSPPLLDFGFITIGQYKIMSFKVRNTGDAKLRIDCLSPPAVPAGLTESPFYHEALAAELQACENTYATGTYLEIVPGSELTFTVKFQPTSLGTPISEFSIESDAEPPKKITLQGGAAGIAVNPASLVFPDTSVGLYNDLSITITNNGAVSYQITSITGVDAPFSIVNPPTLPVTLQTGQSVTLTLRLAPVQVGNFSGTMNIQTSISGLSRTVNLTGKGVASALSISPTALGFGSVTAYTGSNRQITLLNSGSTSISVTSLDITSAGFSLVSPPALPFNISAGGSQNLTVRFSPSEITSYNGSLSIKSSAGAYAVNLTGQGSGGKVNVSKEQIDFGTIATGSSGTINLTVTNEGNAVMNISGITTPSSPFSRTYTGTTPVQLLPGTSYTILVKFSPSTAGNYSSSFIIQTDAINGDKTINLVGTAVTPDISINPQPPVVFPDTKVGLSQSMNLTIKNNGALAVKINSFDLPASPFSITTPTTPYTLNAGDTLNLVIKFSPTTAGSFSSSLGILFDYATTTTTINITGTGISTTAQTANIIFQQNGSQVTSVAFGNVFKGSSSKKTLSVKNNGSSVTTINSVAISNVAFTVTLPSPFTLNAGETRAFDVTFIPTAVQSYSATMTLSDTTGGSYQLSFTGSGTSVNVEKISGTGTVSYFTALTSSQLPTSTKPADFTISKAVEFVIEGVTGGTVTVKATFDSLPSNPIFYKVVGNTWLLLTGYTLSGNTLTYAITDNGPFDSDSTTGIIRDPVVVGSIGGGGGGGGSISSSGGGCSIGGHQNAPTAFTDMAVMLMPLFVIIMLKNIRRKKK